MLKRHNLITPLLLSACCAGGLGLAPCLLPSTPSTGGGLPLRPEGGEGIPPPPRLGDLMRLRGGGGLMRLRGGGVAPVKPSHPDHPEWGETHLPDVTKEVHEAWEETMKMRAEYDKQEEEMDYDLRTSTSRVIDEIERLRLMREKEIKDDLERNGPRWVPPINRHFMDPTNWTTEFGPEFHPPYPCVPTLVMMDPSTRMRESACRGRTYEIYEQIEKEGAEVNKPDDAGLYAAIHWASLMGKTDTVKALLGLGANPNALTRHERNPLHYACDEGHADIVDLLLEAGSDVWQRDLDNMRPIDLARAAGHKEAAGHVFTYMEAHPEPPPSEKKEPEPARKVDKGYLTEPGFATDDASYYTDDEDLKRMGGGKDYGSLWGRASL